MKKHLNIRVYGKVQGVFYRKSTLEAALLIGIKGFVRNEPDGSVYIEAEGTPFQLDKFLEWCKQGPEKAEVDYVETEEGSMKNFIDFSIEY
ncbi:MAG: acylphosphatase [Bacteroidetes bacterium]|nr:MAG: acylphosphatase [Bacteroidota bacterium]